MFNFATFNTLMFNGWSRAGRLNLLVKPIGGVLARQIIVGTVPED